MKQPRTRETIATGLSLQHNALNFLRVFGALLVIVAHSPKITGLGDDPRLGTMQLGILPVSYFFVISGFLITGSRFKLSAGPFTARRLARILPGYWLCMVVTGLGITALAAQETGAWSIRDAATYIARNWLFAPGQGSFGGLLLGNPEPNTWNGPVWTIPMELLCYTAIGCAVAVPLFRRHLRLFSGIGLVGVVTLGTVVAQTNAEPGALYLVAFFATGVLLYAWQDRIPMNDRLALLSLAVVVGCFRFPETVFLATIPFGYLVLWFGARAPDRIKRIGATNDISYGIYVYAWPIQQLLFIYGLADHGLWVFNLTAMACATVLGWMSWLVIERRATEWVRKRTARRRGPEPRGEAARW